MNFQGGVKVLNGIKRFFVVLSVFFVFNSYAQERIILSGDHKYLVMIEEGKEVFKRLPCGSGSIKELKTSSCKQLPNWLLKAATYRERISILLDGTVVWHEGIWRGGIWKGGIWENGRVEKGAVISGFLGKLYFARSVWEKGTWKMGTWNGGIWKNGTWENGRFMSGLWEGGTWKGGIWDGGRWEGGTWEGGTWRVGWWYGNVKSFYGGFNPRIESTGKKLCGSASIEQLKALCSKKLPRWLLEADTNNERVSILLDGTVVWHEGSWLRGTWKKGIWKSGSFRGKRSLWEDGIWESGFFINSIWKNGTWKYGIWRNSEWKDGTWEKGKWSGGIWKGRVKGSDFDPKTEYQKKSTP